MTSELLHPSAVRRIAKEVAALRSDPPEGIRVIINEEDIADVNAWVAGPPGTPYEGGYFRVKLAFEKEYPAAPPKGYFLTKIFHPNVGSQGDICVSTLKRDWSSKSTLTHILTVIKCLLIYPNPESALDEEAGRLLLDRYEEYASRARLMTQVHASVRASKPAEFEVETKAERESRLAAAPATAVEAVGTSVSCVDAFDTPTTASALVPLQPAPSNAQNPNTGPMSPLSSSATGGSKKRSAGSALDACTAAQVAPSNTGENQKAGAAGTTAGAGTVKKVGAAPARKRGLKRL